MISPIHPGLQGIAAERFFALGQELMRRQRSNQCDRLTELSEREASWADHQAGMNGDRDRYKACARVLVDLAKARWRVAEDRFGIELQSPDATLQHALSQQEIERGKSLVRSELQPLLNQQFDSPSVRKFIAQMEQPAKSSKVKPIGLLVADGREVAQRLEPALRAKGPKRVEALQCAVKPYLQLVVSGERDEFTNLLLGDVWRYFRYSWCIPQLPIPGRQLLYLIRDAAHPYHAVMGIASLNNCAMQNKVRDDRIGWTGEAFLTQARQVASSEGTGAGKELKGMLSYLNAQLDIAVSHIETKGLCTARDLEKPTAQLIDSLRRQSGQFAEIRNDALRVISKNRDVPDLVQDYESSQYGQPPVSDEVLQLEDKPLTDRAMTHARRMLVAKKRAAELARLLDAKLTLLRHAAAFVDPKSLAVCAAREEVMTAVHAALLSVKSERVGTNMLELTTCGAVPPYNPILAGKLVALLMMSPQVAADYQKRYGKEASIISSQLKNERRQKDSTLVYLGTTSLFSEGSSQYERLRLPAGTIAPDQPELRYQSLGNTTGYGTVQFSPETVRSVETVLEHEYGYQEVNSVFGEGFSPRLRKLRAGLQMLGFEAEHLLVHHQQRRVFGVQMFPGTADFLMGKKAPLPSYLRYAHRYLDASQRIVDYWTTRWLSMRLDYAPALETLQSVTGWKLSDHLPVSGDDAGAQSSKPPAPPRHKPVSAEVNKVVEFWRSLAFGGPEVCSDVLGEDDLETLHVAQDLDQFLVDRVRKGYSIILTGNAGDGKTHLLRRLEPELKRLNAVVQYDASAAMDHTKIAPILNEWRKARRSNRPYCLAANEYPLYLLREHGRRKPDDLPVLAEVDRQCRMRLSYGEAATAEKAKTEHGKVLVVDLSLRNPLHKDFAGAMLDRLLKNPALAAYAKSNADLNFTESFRRLSQVDPVRKRLLGLFDQLRALGHRATVREMWIVMARLFFGGKPNGMAAVAGRFADWYSERLFDTDHHLSLVEDLRRWADPASVSHPRWDLSLEAAEGTRAEDWLVDRAVPTLDRRRMAHRDGRAVFDAIKRRFYFEHRAGEDAFVLQGGFAQEFRDLLHQSVGHRIQVAEQIVEAINLCYCPAASVEHRSKLYLWVGHRYHEQPSRAFVAQAFFHTTDFDVLLPRLPKRLEGAFDYRPDHFILQLRKGGDRYRLIIDFRLFETLRRVQKGLPRHLLPERDLNRLDSFLTQLHEAEPQRTSEFLIFNQETLTTSRIQVSEDQSQYIRVTRAV